MSGCVAGIGLAWPGEACCAMGKAGRHSTQMQHYQQQQHQSHSLLCLLLPAACRPPLQAILGAPLGVTRLMDLLGEQEVLRNEALLLLTQLAGGSGDLQKIAVFEGAFERLFGIVRCGCGPAGGW